MEELSVNVSTIELRGDQGDSFVPIANTGMDASPDVFNIPGFDFNDFSDLETITNHIDEEIETPINKVYVGYTILIFITGLISNVIVLAVIGSTKGWHEKSSSLIPFNLAIADTLMLGILPFWIARKSEDEKWIFGWILCALHNSVPFINMFVSIFFLGIMALDRYITVVQTRSVKKLRKYKDNPKYLITIVVFIWVFGIILASPVYIRSELHIQDNKNKVCGITWSDTVKECSQGMSLGFPNNRSTEILDKIEIGTGRPCACGLTPGHAKFQTAVFILAFLFPLFALIYCYTSIFIVVFKSEKKMSSRSSAKSTKSFQSRASVRVAALSLILIIAYVICWGPYHLFYTLASAKMLVNLNPESCATFILVYDMLIWTLRVVNPVLYSFLGNVFRQRCANLILCGRSTRPI